MEYEMKTYSIIVKPVGDPMYSECATVVGVDDEDAGVFLTLTQDDKTLTFDCEEWVVIQRAVHKLMKKWDGE